MAYVTSAHVSLNAGFHGKWTEHAGPITCPLPTNSENLKPLDISLWEFMKDVDHIWPTFYIPL